VIGDEAALKEAENKVGALEERGRKLSKKKTLAKPLRRASEETIVELSSIPVKRRAADGRRDQKSGVLEGWRVDLEKNMLLPVEEAFPHSNLITALDSNSARARPSNAPRS